MRAAGRLGEPSPRPRAGRPRSCSTAPRAAGIEVIRWDDEHYPPLLARRSRIRRRCCGCAARPTSYRAAPSPSSDRAPRRAYALEVAATARRRAGRPARARRLGARARGGRRSASRLPRGRRRDRRGARLGPGHHLSARARDTGRTYLSATERWSASSARARRRCRSTFRCEIGSSVGSRWRSWWSKPIGKERIADHGPMRARAGPRRHGGARQRARRPQPRLARASEGRRKGRGDCGRYLGGAGVACLRLSR